MVDFTIHTPETAPEASKPLLQNSQAAYGMIPNLHAAMAEAPATLEAYQALTRFFRESSLSTVEQNVVWMTLNRFHECHYCVPAHTAIAHSDKVDPAIITALRAGTPLPDAKLETLRQTVLAIVEKRGRITDADANAFFAAGYAKANLADILVGVAHKTMSNYFNHFFNTPVDAPFAKFIDDPMGAKERA